MTEIPYSRQGRKKGSKTKRKSLYIGVTPSEFKQIFNATNNIDIKIAYLLSYGAGLRLAETLNLQAKDINLETNKIFVWAGKNLRDRVTFFKSFDNELILKKEYLERLPLQLKKFQIQNHFLKITKELGINRIKYIFKTKSGNERIKYQYHFHCLRHSYALNLMKDRVPMNVIQGTLGHDNMQTTNTYTKISDSQVEEYFKNKNAK